MDFHPTKPFLKDFLGHLIQSIISMFEQYLEHTTLPHKEHVFCMILQRDLAAKALVKRGRFLIPHPPISLGRAILVHLTKRMPLFCLLVVHRNVKDFFWIFVRIPLGM